MKVQTIQVDDKTLVVLQKQDFDALMEKAGVLPALPKKTKRGGYPARQTMAAVISREIVTRRIRAGWTQRELAKRAGLSAEQISRIESGKHRPTTESLTRIEEALKAVEQ